MTRTVNVRLGIATTGSLRHPSETDVLERDLREEEEGRILALRMALRPVASAEECLTGIILARMKRQKTTRHGKGSLAHRRRRLALSAVASGIGATITSRETIPIVRTDSAARAGSAGKGNRNRKQEARIRITRTRPARER